MFSLTLSSPLLVQRSVLTAREFRRSPFSPMTKYLCLSTHIPNAVSNDDLSLLRPQTICQPPLVFTQDQLKKVATTAANTPGYIRPPSAYMETWLDTEANRIAQLCFSKAQQGRMEERIWVACDKQAMHDIDVTADTEWRYDLAKRQEVQARLVQALAKHLPGTCVSFLYEDGNHYRREHEYVLKISWAHRKRELKEKRNNENTSNENVEL